MKAYIDDNLGLAHDIRAIFLKFLKKLGIYQIQGDRFDYFTAFDEYPTCEMCGTTRNKEVLKAIDGCRIVECEGCGLWFTSPRIEENKWIKWLYSANSERNRILTENRVQYGVAMPRNVKLTRSGWYKRHKKEYLKILGVLMRHAKKPIVRIHDVGCGVGFFLMACREEGFDVSGNELNQYAVRIMRERFELDVCPTVLSEVPLKSDSLDAITMNAYIEHTYHPLEDLGYAYNLLKRKGVMYVSTFHTDSITFDKLGSKWDMFEWNHVYHFSSKTLEDMIKKAGFQIVANKMKYELPISYIVGVKA